MPDIVVFGATGFTGRLVTRYLYAHPERKTSFSFAVAARSPSKLNELATELGLDDAVERITVDVTKASQVEEVVKRVRVVINTAGPFYKLGTEVLRACARHGKHYVDITGETHWIMDMIAEFDYLASRTGAIIIPSSAMDSMPSDLSAYLSIRTLKSALGPEATAAHSTSAFKIKGGVSGGTLGTALTMVDIVPKETVARAKQQFSISPVKGIAPPPFRFLYSFHSPGPAVAGAFFMMSPLNKAVVQRTWGLAQVSGDPKLAYGPNFVYDEFMVMPNRLSALLFSAAFAIGGLLLSTFAPFRWLLKRLVPQPGQGPSDEQMKKGWIEVTNITASDSTPPTYVQTVIRGRGDPGYLLTALMISESALVLLDTSTLSKHVQQGGMFTPMSALGDVLVQRLEQSGRFNFESAVVTAESRKTR